MSKHATSVETINHDNSTLSIHYIGEREKPELTTSGHRQVTALTSRFVSPPELLPEISALITVESTALERVTRTQLLCLTAFAGSTLVVVTSRLQYPCDKPQKITLPGNGSAAVPEVRLHDFDQGTPDAVLIEMHGSRIRETEEEIQPFASDFTPLSLYEQLLERCLPPQSAR